MICKYNSKMNKRSLTRKMKKMKIKFNQISKFKIKFRKIKIDFSKNKMNKKMMMK